MLFPNKRTTPFVVRAAAVATTSYVAGTVFSMDEHNYLAIEVVYTKGDETSHEIKVETSDDGGTTYYQLTTKSTSGGTTSIVPGIYQMTAASYPSGVSKVVWELTPTKSGLIKISTKSTGGTPTGTVGINAMTGWV